MITEKDKDNIIKLLQKNKWVESSTNNCLSECPYCYKDCLVTKISREYGERNNINVFYMPGMYIQLGHICGQILKQFIKEMDEIDRLEILTALM